MRRVRFLVIFLLLLGVFEFALLINVVQDYAIVPFTKGVTAVSGSVIGTLEHGVHVSGTAIRASCFAVDIRNGCNGVEATLFVIAAVLAFPAPWLKRLIGVIAAFALIQIANLIRVVTLFMIGCRRPGWFETFHLAVWQNAMFALAIGFFLLWSHRITRSNAASA